MAKVPETTAPASQSPLHQLAARLTADYPALGFVAGRVYCWSPADQHISYNADDTDESAVFSLLHEVGHALLQHTRYRLDVELVAMEVAAWEKARQIAPKYGIDIDEDHVQDCLDSYRDWLFSRSLCPTCGSRGLQQDATTNRPPDYSCFNCQQSWRVSPSRFCRPYRSRTARQPGTSGLMVPY